MNNRPDWADDAARDTDDRCLSCQRRPYETHTLDCRPLPSCGALDVSDDPYDVVSGLACQRERGHDGNHRACDPEGHVAVSWPAAPSSPPAASPSAREEPATPDEHTPDEHTEDEALELLHDIDDAVGLSGPQAMEVLEHIRRTLVRARPAPSAREEGLRERAEALAKGWEDNAATAGFSLRSSGPFMSEATRAREQTIWQMGIEYAKALRAALAGDSHGKPREAPARSLLRTLREVIHASPEVLAAAEKACEEIEKRAPAGSPGTAMPPDETCTNCGAPRSRHTPAANGGLDCPPRADGKVPVVVGHEIVDMDYENHCAVTRPKIEWRSPGWFRRLLGIWRSPGTGSDDEGSMPDANRSATKKEEP